MDRTEKLFWIAACGWPVLAAIMRLDYAFALLPFCFACGANGLYGIASKDFHAVWQALGAMAVYYMATTILYGIFGLPSGEWPGPDMPIQG